MKSKQKLFEEINYHLLNDKKPSAFFNEIEDTILFLEFPFTLLSDLKEVEQSPTHHPEGSVWNHTMLVIDEAARLKYKSEDQNVFMWAALLHDIGKTDTTKNRNGKITAYNHDRAGSEYTKKFLETFSNDSDFIYKVAALVRWHMQILFVVKSLPFADIKKMKQQVNVEEIALLGYCDRMGRLNPDQKKEEENINIFLQKCSAE